MLFRHMRSVRRTFIITFLIILLARGLNASAENVNLVVNGSFEEQTSGKASFWNVYDWENKAGVTEFKLDNTEKRSGNLSACIINNMPNDARFKQVIMTKPASYYKLSCWIKTENVGNGGKGANLSVEGIIDTSRDIKGTTGTWEYVELYGKTADKQESFTLTIGLGGYGSLNTGTAWFDDVCVELLHAPPEGMAVINLYPPASYDTAKAGAKTGRSILIMAAVLLAVFLFGVLYVTLKNRNIIVKKQGSNAKADKTGKTQRKADARRNGGIKSADRAKGAMGSAALQGGNTKKVLNQIRAMEITKLKIDKKDVAIMAAMTLIYLVAALINLGSLKTPQTSWQPIKPGEYFILDLGEQTDISRISYHCGLGRGNYRLEYLKVGGEGEEYALLQAIVLDNYNDFYKWKHINTQIRTSRLKITVEEPGGVLNEIGIFKTGSTDKAINVNIAGKSAEVDGRGRVENLFDEQQLVPYRSTYLDNTYFDEIYHARTAYEHINKIEPYETTHPPLGKIFIALGILIFGMNPFGWRIIGTLFGAAMIPAMYVFGKKLFVNRFYGFCAAFLMMFDFMHFAQTRIATIDVYVTFFVILMYYYMFDYYINKSYLVGFAKSLKPLFLSGLFFGIGVACKWIALYGAAGLAMLFFLAKAGEIRDYIRLKNDRKGRKLPWISNFVPLYVSSTMLYCVLFFIIIPGIIYILSYIPFMMVPGPGHGIQDVFSYQVHMYNYHKNLTATHSFSSSWWQWPIMTKPIWFYSGADMPPGKVSTIVSLGNPAVWWTSIAAIIVSAVIAIKKRDKKMAAVFISIGSQYLPWILVPRIAFIYHYFSIIPFAILSVVYVIKELLDRYPDAKYLVYTYLVITAVFFVRFYPALSGMEVSRKYIEGLKWFKTWIF